MFLVKSTGAADMAFLASVRAPVLFSVPLHMSPPSRIASSIKKAAAPRVVPPVQGLWGALRDRIAPTVDAWEHWLEQPMEMPDPAAWLAALIKEDPRPLLSWPEAQAPAGLAAAPEVALESAQDRMLINHDGFDMILFGQDARLEVVTYEAVAPRLEGPWRQAHGLRFRINYLKPEGYLMLGAHGTVDMTRGSRTRRSYMDLALPPAYLRTYALYHEGDVVGYEIELENITGRDLENLLVFTNQEGFNYRGGMGRLLGQVQLSTIKSLAAGGRVVLSGTARMSGFEAAGSIFEQTHLTVDTEGTQARRTRLVDDPQAGIVDPPRSR